MSSISDCWFSHFFQTCAKPEMFISTSGLGTNSSGDGVACCHAKTHAYELALTKPYGFSGLFLAVSLKVKTENSSSHFSAHTVWLFRRGTFGKYTAKVPGIGEKRAAWQSQMSKQSRRDLAIYYPVTSHCCCFKAERRRTVSAEILDSIKKQHLLRKPRIQLLTSDT